MRFLAVLVIVTAWNVLVYWMGFRDGWRRAGR